jgi:hypothetical protein
MVMFQYFWRFAQISKKFAAFAHKIVFVIVSVVKLFRNNNKNNFARKCCKFLANLQKSWNNMMSNDGLIIENMHLPHIHLAVIKYRYLNSYYIHFKYVLRYDKNMLFEWTKISFYSARQYVLKCTFSRNLDKYLVSISFAQLQLLRKHITCLWHQKTNSPIHQFTNLNCCKMSLKWKSKA